MRIRLKLGEYNSQCKYQSVGRQRETQDAGFAKGRHKEREVWESHVQGRQAREIEATESALKKQGKRTESREAIIPADFQY